MPDNQTNPFLRELASYQPPQGRQAQALERELRMAAAMSPMANALGAGMALLESGVAGQRGAAIDRASFMDQIARSGPAGFVDIAHRELGVSPALAATFLNAPNANREQVLRHGLQNNVRQMQGAEVAGLLAEQMSGAVLPGLKAMGMNPSQRRLASTQISGMMAVAMQELANEDSTAFSDPSKAAARNQKLMEKIQGMPGVKGMPNQMVAEMVAGGVRSAEEMVRSDPDLRKFGSLAGMLEANAMRPEQFGPPVPQKMDQDEDSGGWWSTAKRAAGVQNNDKATGNSRRITGTLTVKMDGTGSLDAEEAL